MARSGSRRRRRWRTGTFPGTRGRRRRRTRRKSAVALNMVSLLSWHAQRARGRACAIHGSFVPVGLRSQARTCDKCPGDAHGCQEAAPPARIRYVKTPDGLRLAWAESGEGQVVVKAANWLTHLEYEWDSPVWKHWLEFFSDNFRFVRYDERGCGMSEWSDRELSARVWTDDLEAVIDAADPKEPVTLLGISQGGIACIGYALRHPERVARLILYGGYARGTYLRSNPQAEATFRAVIDLVRAAWGSRNPSFRQIFTSRFIPEGTPEQLAWFNELCRKTTTGRGTSRCTSCPTPTSARTCCGPARSATSRSRWHQDALEPTFDDVGGLHRAARQEPAGGRGRRRRAQRDRRADRLRRRRRHHGRGTGEEAIGALAREAVRLHGARPQAARRLGLPAAREDQEERALSRAAGDRAHRPRPDAARGDAAARSTRTRSSSRTCARPSGCSTRPRCSCTGSRRGCRADKRKMLEQLHNADAVFEGKKVLIVDDDVRNVFALATVFEAARHGGAVRGERPRGPRRR